MENADESVSTCVCVHVPFTTMCMCLCVCVLRVLVGHLCQRLKDKIHFACICECVCPCALCAADESFSKSRLAALVYHAITTTKAI